MRRTTKLVAVLTVFVGACSTQPDSLTEQAPPRTLVDIADAVVEAAPPTLPPPPVATTPQTTVAETAPTVSAPTTSLYVSWSDVALPNPAVCTASADRCATTPE